MLIVIDQDLDGKGNVMATQVINTDDTTASIDAPKVDPVNKVTIKQLIAHFNTSPADRTAGGFDIAQQLPGELAPRTRWQRIVDTIAHPQAPADWKALNLK